MEGLSKADLRKVCNYLKRVYPGTAEQDDLADLIEKIDRLLKGDNRARGKRG